MRAIIPNRRPVDKPSPAAPLAASAACVLECAPMLPFPLFLAARYLRPKRSFSSVIPVVTILGVMLGVAILMIVLAVMTGFGDVWRDRILSFSPHVVVYGRYGDIAKADELADRIAAMPGVEGACPAIAFPAMLRKDARGGGDPVTVTVLGIDPDRPSVVANAAGKIVDGAYDVREDRALVGRSLAHRLDARPGSRFLCYSPLNLKSADELYFPEEIEVSGVFDMGLAKFDDGVIVCSLGMARDLLGMDGGARMVQVQVSDPNLAWRAADAIEREFAPWVATTTWMQEDQVLFNALRTEKTMMFILLAFIAIVAAFCVTNTLLVITIQKTKEIGLMKALGFSGGKIKAAFVLHGLVQCVLGELLGLGLGWLVLRNLQGLVRLLSSWGWDVFPESVYGLPELPWRVVGSDVAAVVGIVFAFCLAASFLPAWLAARLDPVKAINQE